MSVFGQLDLAADHLGKIIISAQYRHHELVKHMINRHAHASGATTSSLLVTPEKFALLNISFDIHLLRLTRIVPMDDRILGLGVLGALEFNDYPLQWTIELGNQSEATNLTKVAGFDCLNKNTNILVVAKMERRGYLAHRNIQSRSKMNRTGQDGALFRDQDYFITKIGCCQNNNTEFRVITNLVPNATCVHGKPP